MYFFKWSTLISNKQDSVYHTFKHVPVCTLCYADVNGPWGLKGSGHDCLCFCGQVGGEERNLGEKGEKGEPAVVEPVSGTGI